MVTNQSPECGADGYTKYLQTIIVFFCSMTKRLGLQYVRYNGRTSGISVVECGVYLKARCPDRSIFRSIRSRCLRYRWRARLRHSWICRWHADLQPLCRRRTCTTSHPGVSTASVVSGCGWRTIDSSLTHRKLNSYGSVRLVVWPSVRLSRSWSTDGTSILPSKTVRNLRVVLDPS